MIRLLRNTSYQRDDSSVLYPMSDYLCCFGVLQRRKRPRTWEKRWGRVLQQCSVEFLPLYGLPFRALPQGWSNGGDVVV